MYQNRQYRSDVAGHFYGEKQITRQPVMLPQRMYQNRQRRPISGGACKWCLGGAYQRMLQPAAMPCVLDAGGLNV